jgi:hypothetical protein
MIVLKLVLTPDGNHAMWQQGGGSAEYGEGLVIADPWGRPKRPVDINQEQDHNHHVLIPVQDRDIVVMMKKTKNHTFEKVFELRRRCLRLLNVRTDGVWKMRPKDDRQILPALAAAAAICKRPAQHARFFIIK